MAYSRHTRGGGGAYPTAEEILTALRGKRMAQAKEYACGYCGHVGKGKLVTGGSFLIEAVLWFFFILPGLIYSLWRLTSRHLECPDCGSRQLVPANSPAGRRIVEAHRR